jgi:hypothetical protein
MGVDGVGIDPAHRRSVALWLSKLSNVIGV